MIDKKQLRIGNHVRCKGIDKIVQIYELDSLIVSVMESDKDAPTLLDYDDLAPIPLTAELLQELGFVKKTRYDNDKDYYIDAESARQMEKTRLVVPQIELQNYSEIAEPELWQVRILRDNKSSISNAHFATEARIDVRYLHELEQFVYLTIGKELVE